MGLVGLVVVGAVGLILFLGLSFVRVGSVNVVAVVVDVVEGDIIIVAVE